MFIIAGQKSKLTEALLDLLKDVREQSQRALEGIRSLADLTAKVREQREALEKLEIEKGRREEEYARKEREIEHKVGLVKKQQEFELAAAKRDAVLTVKEENLAADRKRFEEQMAFVEKRFTEQVEYLKGIIGSLSERLPNVSAHFESKASKRG